MAECDGILTIKRYLKGKVRGVEIPDDALLAICADASVEPETIFGDATQRQKDLATAYLYLWIADGPTQWGGYTEESADWKSSENGLRMSKATLDDLRAKAEELLEKYDIEVPGVENWGFVGRGIRNPRNYRI